MACIESPTKNWEFLGELLAIVVVLTILVVRLRAVTQHGRGREPPYASDMGLRRIATVRVSERVVLMRSRIRTFSEGPVVVSLGRLLVGVVLILGVGPFGTNTHALGAILYGTNGNSLITLDPDTQTVEVVGAHGIAGLQSLAFHSSDCVFYGTTDSFGYGQNALWSINPFSGAATQVALLPAGIYGLDYDPARDALYGVGLSSQLYRINTQPFNVQYVGSGGRDFTYSLAIDDRHDVFYSEAHWGAELFSIDPATGAGTTVGEMGWIWLSSMAYDQYADRLIGVDTVSLLSIVPATMTTTSLGSLPFRISGLDYAPNVIPEPSTLIIWSLLGFVTFGIASLRKRRKS